MSLTPSFIITYIKKGGINMLKFKHVKKITSILLMFVLLLSIAGCNANKGGQTYKPGTYTSTAKGKNGDVKVEVTLTQSEIKSVKVLEQNETQGVATPALENIANEIVKNQTLKVDVVSGATMTSNAILEAVADCIKQAGGDVEALKNKETAEKKKVAKTVETDIVVVGGGASGTAAALAASEKGKHVILIEKTATPAGAGTFAGVLFATDSQLQKDAGKTVDPKWVYDQFMETSQYHANGALIAKVIAKSGSTVDWLIKNGVKLNLLDPGHGGVVGHVGNPTTAHGYAEGGVVAITHLHEVIKKNGGEVLYQTTGKKILLDDKKQVCGVIAEQADGTELTIKAKSVIIATGGFAGNSEMTKQIFGDVNFGTPVVKSNVGDGIKMAWEVGAARGIIIPQNYGINPDFLKASKELKELKNYSTLTAAFSTPLLFVNNQGTRFTNEEVVLEAAHGAEALRSVVGGEIYAIADQSIFNSVKEKGLASLVDRYSMFKGNNQRYIEAGHQVDTDQRYKDSITPVDVTTALDKAVEEGIVIKANTIDELAQKLNMPNLKDTMNRYNELCASGKDTDHYKNSIYMDKLTTAPYYAVKYKYVNYLGTLGGVQVDENLQAVQSNGQPIANLWVAGADASGAYGNAYVPFEGGTLGFAYNTGRIAGENAAENCK